jgi:hypothetical protein
LIHSSKPIAVNAMAQTVRADLFSSKAMMEIPVFKQGKTNKSRVIHYFRSSMPQCQSLRGSSPNTGSFDPFVGIILPTNTGESRFAAGRAKCRIFQKAVQDRRERSSGSGTNVL